ncbi:MAG: response regulator [Deltaproteobacteria bacterium]|nr:response regulator [Deltaproteobacteria bacterium]
MKNIRLLLVDDEINFVKTLVKRMEKRGLFPDQAASGEECLAILEKKPMDVVVLDVKMPGMDGIEVLPHIKEKYPKTEVLFLTGHASPQDGVDGIKAGGFDYLTKPIEFEQLITKINQAYDKIRLMEEKEKEAEFRAGMEQQMIAAERLASLGTLAAGVAHEINNPLAIINESIGWMKLILNKEELAQIPRKADFEKVIEKIETAVDRAGRITHQLLGVVRKTDSVPSELNLNALIDDTVQLVSREASNKDIEIVMEMDSAVASVWVDAYQLRQVLINLLTNAIHATPKQGNIAVILEDMGNQFALKIKDNGEGIPKENMEKIFEPFFSTKSPGEGTGLGLFVTRGIVEKLGGKIEMESRLGHGTVFSVILPKYHEVKRDLEEGNHLGLFQKIKKSLQGH